MAEQPGVTTLTDAQVAALREAAEKATHGTWTACRMVHGDRGDDLTPAELGEYVANSVIKSRDASGSSAFLFVSVEKPDGPADVCHVGNGPTSPANAAHIAAASPDVVLALLAERDALKRQVTFLKGELSQLANFNPDWDMLQATRESLQEHQARLREISYLLSDAGVGAGTLREGVISLRERSEAAEASLARVQSAAQTIVRGSDLRVLEATAHEPEARVAIATLDSERAMNAQLTAELEAAEAALSALRARETGLREAMHAIYKGLSSEKDGEFWTAQKWCDDHDIYVDNLQGLRVLEEIARVVMSEGVK